MSLYVIPFSWTKARAEAMGPGGGVLRGYTGREISRISRSQTRTGSGLAKRQR